MGGGIDIWIGIDDTDSRKHGCTTFLAMELISEFNDFNLIGYPYLVRLNPNIPWKTRGNGAVCLHFAKPANQTVRDYEKVKNEIIGKDLKGNSILNFRTLDIDERSITPLDLSDLISRTEKVLVENASLEDATTNPGIVVTTESALPAQFYWSAVRDVVELENIKKGLDSLGASYLGMKNGRGIIGASAAISWAENIENNSGIYHDFTYELIGYRSISRWGTKREVDISAIIELDKKLTSTFNNYDYDNNHVAITPNSPCPVLFGIRGNDVTELKEGLVLLEPTSEPVDRWVIFKTNQGTDDHLISTNIDEIKPFTSVIVSGRVSNKARSISGGHVLFDLESMCNKDKTTITCAAYEPTKGFRDVVRDLLPGDELRVFGGIREQPMTINMEKFEILKLVDQKLKTHNPRCSRCGSTMKSLGLNKGFRCKKCRTKSSEDSAEYRVQKRRLSLGFYEVPVCARRHLSKPLKRLNVIPGQYNGPPKGF